jgi:hypothetical protein
MKKLPSIKSVINLPSIFENYTFEDIVTLGRVNAIDATNTCIAYAQKEHIARYGLPRNITEAKRALEAWDKLENQVLRKFKQAEKIASIL